MCSHILRGIAFIVLLCQTFSMGPEQLKPCFERYDGHKLFDATPFHSEWKMKTEEQCLPFCVKAPSRCASIVYDKMNHICHYFTVNGIEFESIEKSPKMVYLQVAERRCIDDMNSAMEAEERASSPPQLPSEPISGLHLRTYAAEPMAQDDSPPKPTYGTQTLETKVEVPDPIDPNNSGVDASMNVTSREVPLKEEEVETPTTAVPVDLESTSTTMTKIMHEEINRDISEGEQQPAQATTETAPSLAPAIETLDPNAMPALLPPMEVFNPAKKDSTEKENNIRRHPTRAGNWASNSEVSHPTSTHSHVQSPDIVHTPMDRGRWPKLQEKANKVKQPVYYGSRQELNKKEQHPHASILPTSLEANIVAGVVMESEACKGDVNTVWMAVENSKIASHMNSSMEDHLTKHTSDSSECMKECKSRAIPHRSKMCDSFTYYEREHRCLLDAMDDLFPKNALSPSEQTDFTTRAFHKFCYPGNLSPFTDCSEFLAFRDYSLDMIAREIFDGLPTGREGLSACLELCVLSNEFKCKSALFDSELGNCKIYDEHSLTNPVAFKEHRKQNLLYFENGCIESDIPQEPVMSASVQRVKPTTRPPSSSFEPVRIDFRKVV